MSELHPQDAEPLPGRPSSPAAVRGRATAGLRRSLRAAARRLGAGEQKAAERICRGILERHGEDPEALHLLGIMASRQGKYERAEERIRKAIAGRPEAPTFHNSLGIVLLNRRQLDEAEAAHRRAVELDPGFAVAHFNLGNVRLEQQRFPEAVAAYRKALRLRPDYIEAHLNLGVAELGRGRIKAAATAVRKALRLDPSQGQSYLNLAQVYLAQGERPRALATLRKAVEVEPDFYPGYLQLGVFHGSALELEAAADAYRRAIALRPEHPAAHRNLAMTLLHAGELGQGFQEYEWRYGSPVRPVRKAGHDQPVWDGSPLAGRRILLVDEQGLGDTIHFIRYAPLVKARGGVVCAECAEPLYRLLRTCPGIDHLSLVSDKPPEFDLQIPLASLPRVFATTLDAVPTEVPYLFPPATDDGELDRGLAATGDELKVGIAWAGNPHHPCDVLRSTAVEYFGRLSKIPGVRLFSLQFGPRAADLRRWPGPGGVVDLGSVLGDFSHTAAIVLRLDLVITVDTSTAHLAGAVGQRVWTLLHFHNDWRWLTERSDTPWYPTMRLFRQPALGDWPAVFAEVAGELRWLVGSKSSRNCSAVRRQVNFPMSAAAR